MRHCRLAARATPLIRSLDDLQLPLATPMAHTAVADRTVRRTSLSRTTMWRMGIPVVLVICGLTALSYWNNLNTATAQWRHNLRQYVVERAERERQIFRHAERNQAIFREQFLDQWATKPAAEVEGGFGRLVARQADGTLRNAAGFDGTRASGIFIGPDAEADADLRRQIVISTALCVPSVPRGMASFKTPMSPHRRIQSLFIGRRFQTGRKQPTAICTCPVKSTSGSQIRRITPRRGTWTGLFLTRSLSYGW